MVWSIKVDNKNDDRVEFQLSDVPLSVANGLRRVCLAEIPGVAIDPKSITFSQDDGNINSSCLDDEVLAARLTLLPVKIPVEDAEMYEIKMCNQSNPEAPYENTRDAIELFTTQNLVIFKNHKPIKHNDVFHEEMLITSLKPGEQLKTSCKLLAQSPQMAAEQAMAWSCCWVTQWEYKTEKPESEPRLLSEQYKYVGAENGDPRYFLIGIETNGYFAKNAIEVVKTAWGILLNKVEKVIDHLKKHGHLEKGVYIPTRDSSGMLQDATYMSVEDDPAIAGLRKYHFYSEDDTLGHLLVEAVLELQRQQGNNPQSYVGYEKTPFAELLLKIRDGPDKDPTKLLSIATEQLQNKLQDAYKQWNALSL